MASTRTTATKRRGAWPKANHSPPSGLAGQSDILCNARCGPVVTRQSTISTICNTASAARRPVSKLSTLYFSAPLYGAPTRPRWWVRAPYGGWGGWGGWVELFCARSVLNTRCVDLWCSVRVSVARNQRPDVPSARPLRQSLSCCPQGRRNDNMLFKGEVRTKRRMSCRLGQPHRTTQQRRTTKRSRPGPRWPGGMTWQYRARSSDSEAVSIRTVIVA